MISQYLPKGNGTHLMSDDEKSIAEDIYDKFSIYRVTRGLPLVEWSDELSEWAYLGAVGFQHACEKGGEKHLLGVPEDKKDRCDDILVDARGNMNLNRDSFGVNVIDMCKVDKRAKSIIDTFGATRIGIGVHSIEDHRGLGGRWASIVIEGIDKNIREQ